MTNKIVFKFNTSGERKRYLEKVKALPYVRYATDYVTSGQHYAVMVCGEFNEEQETTLRKLAL